MKKLLSLIMLLILISTLNVTAQTLATKNIAPFQGTKEFCEFYQRSKYIVSIKNSSVAIEHIYNRDTSRIDGKIINGKLYTNDPEEKKDKSLAGKYYLLTKDMIRILNSENGDYDQFDLCK